MTPLALNDLIQQYRGHWERKPGVRGVGGVLAGEDGWLAVYVDDVATAASIEASVDGIRVEAVVRGSRPPGPVE